MLLRTARLSAVVASLALAACSSAAPSADAIPDGGADAANATIPASDYCETTVDFFCDYYLRCGRMVASSLDDCRATFLETCNARYEQRYVDLEAAGLLTLSSAGVEACRAHLASVACDRQLGDLDGPCASMWVGSQPAGAPCGLDVESFTCAPGTACVLGLDLCGTCEPTAPVGGACGDGTTCAADASCVSGACLARVHVGDACSTDAPCPVGASCSGGVCVAPTIVDEGASCDAAHRCRYRSACIGGKCVRAALLGEDCSATTCASGRCVTEGSARVCRALLDVGAPCGNPLECRSASCVAGTCAALPDACFPPT